MSSTTEHLDYAETPSQKSRKQLERDLTRARSRIETLTAELAEARKLSRSRAKVLVRARERILELERLNATLHRASATKVVDVLTSAIKQALTQPPATPEK
jgi:hypothetical protein